MATFVLVHGAWSGGWCYARVAAMLRARGHTVFTPTLTGQGERSHLLTDTVNLSMHIADVLAVFHYEGLSDACSPATPMAARSHCAPIHAPCRKRSFVSWTLLSAPNETISPATPARYGALR